MEYGAGFTLFVCKCFWNVRILSRYRESAKIYAKQKAERNLMKSYTIFSIVAAFAVLSAGAERVVKSFNDGWEFAKEGGQFAPVAVPHDWAIAGPFDPNGSGGTGKLPWKGKGRYRKTLVLAEKPRGRVFIEFDGVMARAVAKVNGYPAGLGRYGYLGFRAEATQYLVPGTNVVEVEADTNPLILW